MLIDESGYRHTAVEVEAYVVGELAEVEWLAGKYGVGVIETDIVDILDDMHEGRDNTFDANIELGAALLFTTLWLDGFYHE